MNRAVIQALVAAQSSGDRHAEAIAIRALTRRPYPANQNDGKTPFWRFIEKLAFGSSDCWIWTGTVSAGYGRMTSLGENKAHRVAWRLFKGDIPKGMKVLHACDLMLCVNPGHLFLGTQQDNIRDMCAKGRQRSNPVCGEKNPAAKLNSRNVARMRELRFAGMPFKKIAQLFNVSTMTAYRAVVGQSWKDQ